MAIQATLRIIVLTVIGTMALASARADSLVLASTGTAANPNQTNSNGATVPVKKNSAWAPALAGSSWVSFAPTGDTTNPEFTSVPVGTVVTFFDVFRIAQNASGGTLRLMADDSARVILNGAVIYGEVSPDVKTHVKCSAGEDVCLTAVTIKIPANLLHFGSNTLEFRVAHRNGVSFGLDYIGTVNFTDAIYPIKSVHFSSGRGNPIAVPEPSSLAMLSAGLLALWALTLLCTRKTST